jgi:SAM-dependent methyltransferase
VTTPLFISKRNQSYQKISGKGLEIGAFEHPAKLPSACEVFYCDVISKQEALSLFPEIDKNSLVEVDEIIDLDINGLDSFESYSQDFVIINHVLEHLFNPVFAICECFRVLKKDGLLFMSVPDKRYTFDKNRPLTSKSQIFERIKRCPPRPMPSDYIDMLRYVHPEMLENTVEVQQAALMSFLHRREHLNIWTDITFVEFLEQLFIQNKINSNLIHQVRPSENQFEFFGVWQKN